jgi:ELWxxDGT repeat protein
VLVSDIVPGPGSSSPAPLLGGNGVLFFLASDPATGRELWRSDGTDAGTWLLADIFPGPGEPPFGGGPSSIAAAGDTVAFAANDGVHGREPWRSDGVTAELLMDINPGPASSLHTPPLFLPLAGVNSLVLFGADDGTHGVELWATDGVSATGMIQDIANGAGSSSPVLFTPMGPLVFFTANDNITGEELWAIPRPALQRALNTPESTSNPSTQDDSSPRSLTFIDDARELLPSYGGPREVLDPEGSMR